jgi:hypothetical protein
MWLAAYLRHTNDVHRMCAAKVKTAAGNNLRCKFAQSQFGIIHNNTKSSRLFVRDDWSAREIFDVFVATEQSNWAARFRKAGTADVHTAAA